ncbi:hypothetical protein ACJZ2D_003143 [Fusarium nematophilum]
MRFVTRILLITVLVPWPGMGSPRVKDRLKVVSASRTGLDIRARDAIMETTTIVFRIWRLALPHSAPSDAMYSASAWRAPGIARACALAP